jgi:hypothetical protein
MFVVAVCTAATGLAAAACYVFNFASDLAEETFFQRQIATWHRVSHLHISPRPPAAGVLLLCEQHRHAAAAHGRPLLQPAGIGRSQTQPLNPCTVLALICDIPEENAKQQVRNPARYSMHLHPGCTVFHSKLFPQLIQAGPAAARAYHSAGNSFVGRWPNPTSLPQVRCVALPILLHLVVAHRPGSLSSCATVGTFSSKYHSA